MASSTTAAAATTTLSASKPRLLILGASFGGLGTLYGLRRNGGLERFDVTVVDARDYFTIGGTWQFVWNGRLPNDNGSGIEQVQWPLEGAALLEHVHDVRLNTRVTQWNAAAKTVTTEDNTTIPYDFMVLACGIVNTSAIPGLERHVNLCSLTDVPRQTQELQQLIQKAQNCTNNDDRLTFVVGIAGFPYKCPPAPFEVACLVEEALTKAGVREKVRIVMTCPIEWPMPLSTRHSFLEQLERRRIEFLPLQSMERIVDETGGETASTTTIHFTPSSKTKLLKATLLWAMHPIRAPDFVRAAIPTNRQGFVTVPNKITHRLGDDIAENVYAVGDCCTVPFMEQMAGLMPRSFPLPALPKNGEFSWKMGLSVADALLRIQDEEEDNDANDNNNNTTRLVDRKGSCIAEIGYGQGLRVTPDFSNVCANPDVLKPTVEIELSDRAEEGKLAWVNSYLTKIFGDKARTL